MARIMVVDDSAFMRSMLAKILVKRGHEVVMEAANGVDAVAKYASVKPDIVTMDITMPEMDGITAVKQIKNLDARARIIVCSAMGQQATVVEAIMAGATDFVVKPFQEERVLQSIHLAMLS